MNSRPRHPELRPVPGGLRGRRLAGYLWLLRRWPLPALLDKAALKARRAWRNRLQRFADRRHASHPELPDDIAPGGLQRRLALEPGQHGMFGPARIAALRIVAEQHLRHRFDLLGSGWVEVRHGMLCRGLQGHVFPPGNDVQADQAGEWLRGRINDANLAMSRTVWSQVSPGYVPIDWQLDFISGYRWRESDWHMDIRFGHAPGIDIKLPWELARMQHLAVLAHAYALSAGGHQGFQSPAIYASEFRDQLLDFIATNPPRFGVNWSCTMDVAIRAANWLLAWDLFRAAGAQFDPTFEAVFMQSLFAHGLFIVGNLEWQPELRTNHYLANIAGLLFVAAYLPGSRPTDAWLAFGMQELIAEVGEQFHPDGSNFEASTAYHRLAAELVVYATALVAGLPASRIDAPTFMSAPTSVGWTASFPPWYWQRVERMAEFVMAITRPDGRAPQIGDNDSGRLFKLLPSHRLCPPQEVTRRYSNLRGFVIPPGLDPYPLEDHGDQHHLVAAVAALVARDDFARFAQDHSFETTIVASLAARFQAPPSGTDPATCGLPAAGSAEAVPAGHSATHVFKAGPGTDLRAGLLCRAYPDFGLYVYRSATLYLAVRCGPVGLKGLGAHAHNDALSIELWIDDQPRVVDPGCYLYTALPAQRNAFRSVAAHFSPHFEHVEPASLDQGLFALGDDASPECLVQDADLFVGCYRSGPHRIFRQIRIEATQVTVSDWTDAPHRKLAPLQVHRGPFSDAYGWLRADLGT